LCSHEINEIQTQNWQERDENVFLHGSARGLLIP
jgi:hypothetical protein